MTLKLGTEIPGTSAEGNITTIWVPAIKNIKAPTIIELEAVTLMHEGASGYIVRRRGMATDAPLASGQKLTVVSVKCGEKKVINPDANTMIRSQIPLFAQAPGWESETAVLTAA